MTLRPLNDLGIDVHYKISTLVVWVSWQWKWWERNMRGAWE